MDCAGGWWGAWDASVKVEDSPDNGSKTSRSTQGSTLVLVVIVVAPAAPGKPGSGTARAVGPGSEPEDQREAIENESSDSVEELGGAEFEAERAAVDDECLDDLLICG